MSKPFVPVHACSNRAAQLGFRSAQLGGSYLVWALNAESTNLDEFMTQLMKNRPEYFNKATRRKYGI